MVWKELPVNMTSDQEILLICWDSTIDKRHPMVSLPSRASVTCV